MRDIYWSTELQILHTGVIPGAYSPGMGNRDREIRGGFGPVRADQTDRGKNFRVRFARRKNFSGG